VTGAWRLAWRGLARNRRRNLTTGLAIAVGYAGLVVLGGYANRIEHLIRTSTVYLQHGGHVAVYREHGLGRATARPAAYSLSPDEQRTIATILAADPRVEFWGQYLRGNGLAGNGCTSRPFQALGVELAAERRILEHAEVKRWSPELGRPQAGLALPYVQGVEGAVALSTGLAVGLRKQPTAAAPGARAQPIDCGALDANARIAADSGIQLAGPTFDGALSAADAQVVAIFRGATPEEDQSSVVAELGTLQRLQDTDRVTSVAVFLRDAADAPAVARDLATRLAAAGLRTSVYRYDDPEVNPYYVGTVGFVGALVGFIGLLVAVVATLSVLNAMTLAVIERTREVGTLRSIGFTRRQVLALFLREAAALAALGTLAGLALGLAAVAAVNRANLRFAAPGFADRIQLLLHPTATQCLAIAALILPLTLAATWIAVRRRLRTGVAELLTTATA